MKEILNIPDNIPQDLIDKTVRHYSAPSVKKARSVSAAATAAV